MRTKETMIRAILKRTKEILEKAEYEREFTITIRGGVDEITTIEYDIDESVIDWSEDE